MSFKQAEMRREARFYSGLMLVLFCAPSAGAALLAAGIVSRSFVQGSGAVILILLIAAYFMMRPAVMQDRAVRWVHKSLRKPLQTIFWKW